MQLNQFIESEKCHMFDCLRDIVSDLTDTMRQNPSDYVENGCDEPSIDVRLCIDVDSNDKPVNWIFRTGLSDYDQVHSRHCAASSVQLDTNANSLLNDLINQLD
jgi:hypothetical protein